MKSCVRRALHLLVVMCFYVPALLAQSEADIKTHVSGHLLYLSGLWASNTLPFDSAGHLQGDGKPTSFTLSGIQIKKVKLKGDRLLLEGDRYGLRVNKTDVQPINLHDRVRIELATPKSGDFNSRLDEILVPRLEDLLPKIPLELQKEARQFFVHDPAGRLATKIPSASGSPVYNVGGAIKAPVLLQHVDPQFSAAARKQKLGGTVLVSCHVERDGTPSHVEVAQPAGLGLDEQAAYAVSQYKFQPAMYKDQPVVVELKVEVKFEIW